MIDLAKKVREANVKEAAERPAAAAAESSSRSSTSNATATPARSAGKGGDARDKANRRFRTFNAFTDSVGRYVPAHAREAWHVVFRFADAITNEAELRVPDISARLGCDDRTVERGLKWLMVAGLITRLRRGTRQGGASRYFIDPDPGRRLDDLKAMHEERDGRKRPRIGRAVPPANRAKSGRFTTRQR